MRRTVRRTSTHMFVPSKLTDSPQAQSLQSFRSNFDRIASTLRWLGTSGVRFLMQFWFSKQALFWIPQGWAPYYVEWLLSFPRAPLGSVSVNMWWIACASVIKMASEGLVALWTLKTGEVKVGEKKGEKVKMDFGAGMGQAGEKKEL